MTSNNGAEKRGLPSFHASESEVSGHSFLDDAEPRPAPKIPLFPIPFTIEKPKMEVPDVSLIFNSSKGSNTYLNASSGSPNQILVPISVSETNSTTGIKIKNNDKFIKPTDNTTIPSFDCNLNTDELKQHSLVRMVESQGALIVKLEEKLDKILKFQDRFLSQMFQKVGPAVSKEVQTESSTPLQLGSTNPKDLKNGLEISAPNSPNSWNSSFPIKSNLLVNKTGLPLKGPLSKLKSIKCNDKKDDDLSAILKDIQLPNMDEPSVFSDASGVRSLELQEFNDDSFRSGSGIDSPTLGASASTFGSNQSSDSESDDVVKPTATFYNNVLGNVNRLLEGRSTKKLTMDRDTNLPSPKSLIPDKQGSHGRRPIGLESSGISGNSRSSSSSDFARSPIPNDESGNNEVVEATKKYLEKLGVQFGSPSASENKMNIGDNSKNYMIQQNVYNSIYIPTVNCPPIMAETYSNADSGHFQKLARKYVPPQELQQFDDLQAQNTGSNGGTTDTTVYGMSPNNLSFATKQYLQRYGLVHEQGLQNIGQKHPTLPKSNIFLDKIDSRSDRILDITAIKNQPKLL